MADKAITELVEASQVTATDLFVLQQDSTAKKLSGQTLINYLLKMIDGHGGVRSWEKVASVGLVDTYRFTMSDETAFEYTVSNGRAIDSITPTTADGLTRTYTIAFNDGSSESFTVTDGRGILSFEKTATDGLVDTYTIVYNNGDSDTFSVKNGEKGDKGDNANVFFKFASEKPVDSSSSFGDLPDNWMGIYSGHVNEAPEDYSLYTWFKVKGDKGDTGDPATLVSALTTYQVGDSGNVIPSGIWSTTIPVVPQGKYLWTRQVIQFNSGDPITTYSVARFGIDGAGSVSSVAGISPDESGNVPLTASDVKALPLSGGNMEGPINMNGQTLSGLNAPTEEDEAATKGYVDENGGDLVVDLEDAGAGEPNGINADTLGGQLPEYYATKEEVDTKISMKLLWENLAYNDSFAGNVALSDLNLSGYANLRILFQAYASTGIFSDSGICETGKKIRLQFITDGTVNVSGSYRDFDSSTKTFGNAHNATSGEISNSSCIPYKIYGIKGVM